MVSGATSAETLNKSEDRKQALKQHQPRRCHTTNQPPPKLLPYLFGTEHHDSRLNLGPHLFKKQKTQNISTYQNRYSLHTIAMH